MQNVTQPALVITARDGRFRVDDRDDRPDDEVPIHRQGQRNDWLNVERVAHRVCRADAEIPVVLQRHANQVGDRILEFLSQFGLWRLLVSRRSFYPVCGMQPQAQPGEAKERNQSGMAGCVFDGSFHA